MTTASTLIAIGFLPLNVSIYSKRFVTTGIKINYASLTFTCVVVVVGVLLGILTRHFNRRLAKWFELLLIPSSIVVTFVTNVFVNTQSSGCFWNLPWPYWISAW